MKKALIISVIIPLVILMLASIFQAIPTASAITLQDCDCTHWDITDEDTVDDIMTVIGLSAHWGSYYFSSVDCIFVAASGGTWDTYSLMYCQRKAMDSNYNWENVQTEYYAGAWQPYNFPGGEDFTYADHRENDRTYTYDGTTKAAMFSGLAKQYFQNPSNPSTYWLCGAYWSTVSAIGG